MTQQHAPILYFLRKKNQLEIKEWGTQMSASLKAAPQIGSRRHGNGKAACSSLDWIFLCLLTLP